MINLKKIPTKPGVYIYRNSKGDIIYIGKAINLKKRVSQYWERDDALGPKTKVLISQVASIETKIVTSEIQALVLEASLIKKYRPKYNSLLKDDKSYLYITISRGQIPIVSTARSSNLPQHSDIFGPFPNGSAVNSLLKTIRHIFPFRTSLRHPQPQCLYCHLHLCPGQNPNSQAYRQTINKIKQILRGRFHLLQKQLKKEMQQLSATQNYEAALTTRNQLDAINYVVSGWHNLSGFFDKINLPEDQQSQALNELFTTLGPYLKIKHLNRLECFDISQLGHNYFVGSMVVYQDGKIDPSQYRKFKIKTKFTPDDQFMIREVVYRRLGHPEWGSPDLIIVDGGKPQVSSILPITSVPIIGLAKKFETIVIKSPDNWVQINLPPQSSALHLLEQLRNEAHRFANRYRQELISRQLK
ncbi:hypothetical protein A3K55_02680 [Candidatus Shapirobacteria bacterium RBG_13_44_7]|uniref:Excinuclease ABC subunit C n=1 Tax=Candidatus Shapirobacteria bacterium RBG_13_44_7 TaxID=1802149 RepID=A0A1F7SEL0_9BACT|nr:MAG: hypothetical protein A3K55_02680 [Candidatus Shapirobacteria bacterium RBG_13_44_7]